MQERYLGDSHDFAKFALLRHAACSYGVRPGLNWYLAAREVDHAANSDGEQRHHIHATSWRGWDDELREGLRPLQHQQRRTLAQFYRLKLLPANTCYHDAPLEAEQRAQWHAGALNNLKSAEFVFLDPDNGFAVPSMTRKRSSKYLLPHEFADYAALSIVTAIQFAQRKPRDVQLAELVARLKPQLGRAQLLPIIRLRTAPNTFYISACPKAAKSDAVALLKSYVRCSDKLELLEL